MCFFVFFIPEPAPSEDPNEVKKTKKKFLSTKLYHSEKE